MHPHQGEKAGWTWYEAVYHWKKGTEEKAKDMGACRGGQGMQQKRNGFILIFTLRVSFTFQLRPTDLRPLEQGGPVTRKAGTAVSISNLSLSPSIRLGWTNL